MSFWRCSLFCSFSTAVRTGQQIICIRTVRTVNSYNLPWTNIGNILSPERDCKLANILYPACHWWWSLFLISFGSWLEMGVGPVVSGQLWFDAILLLLQSVAPSALKRIYSFLQSNLFQMYGAEKPSRMVSIPLYQHIAVFTRRNPQAHAVSSRISDHNRAWIVSLP